MQRHAALWHNLFHGVLQRCNYFQRRLIPGEGSRNVCQDRRALGFLFPPRAERSRETRARERERERDGDSNLEGSGKQKYEAGPGRNWVAFRCKSSKNAPRSTRNRRGPRADLPFPLRPIPENSAQRAEEFVERIFTRLR